MAGGVGAGAGIGLCAASGARSRRTRDSARCNRPGATGASTSVRSGTAGVGALLVCVSTAGAARTVEASDLVAVLAGVSAAGAGAGAGAGVRASVAAGRGVRR